MQKGERRTENRKPINQCIYQNKEKTVSILTLGENSSKNRSLKNEVLTPTTMKVMKRREMGDGNPNEN